MAQAKAAKPNLFQRLMKYFKDVRAELRRVVWPTRNEVVNSSLVVIVMLVIMTAFVAVMDLITNAVIIDFVAKIGSR
jgi:preprotein translocase subunit SecE